MRPRPAESYRVVVQPDRYDPEIAALLIVAREQLTVFRAQLTHAASQGVPCLAIAGAHATLDQLEAALAEASHLLPLEVDRR
ncbi:hypothetical protein [Krasilnikovia sp. MM14-A1259]|uniref:hypothetical protein n=1 Tax=Krasilnikovia sp. MM14-A1259 TaxID=3373539 RepID=UPI003818A9D8